MEKTWEKVRNNEILSGDGFFISYNKDTGVDHMGGLFASMGNAILGAAGSEEELQDGEETAIVLEEGDRTFLILEGDYRKEYEEAFPSLEKCMAVYEKHKAKHQSNWSTDKNLL